MIIPENILKAIFIQLPKVVDSNSKEFDVRFNWGSQDALNLFLSQFKTTEKYPLIWMVESDETQNVQKHSAEKQTTLIIAKKSNHVTNTNPIIWETEFKITLDPLLQNVLTALNSSGVTTIKDGNYKVRRLANYSENQKESKTIDNWNVIVFDALIKFNDTCIKQIKF